MLHICSDAELTAHIVSKLLPLFGFLLAVRNEKTDSEHYFETKEAHSFSHLRPLLLVYRKHEVVDGAEGWTRLAHFL